jgi:DNA repair protein SbcD/Mre11
MSLTFLHAADLHLDSPMKGLREHASPLAERFAQSTNRAFENLIALAIEKRVEAVLLAGDLYDRKDRSLKARFVLRDGLQKLAAAQIKTFIVHGNHDPLSGANDQVPLPDSVHVFHGHWSEQMVQSASGIRYRVQGMSYPQSEMSENLALQYRRTGDELSLGLLHANVSQNPNHQNYAACSEADLMRTGLDYLALGHVHSHQVYRWPGGAAAYSGNLQARHRGESGEKGALLVTLDETRSTPPRVEFVACDVLRWHVIDCDADAFDHIEALMTSVLAEARLRIENSGLGEGVVALKIRGGNTLMRELKRADAQHSFEDRLERELVSCSALLELVDYVFLVGQREASSSPLSVELSTPLSEEQLDELWETAGLNDLDVALRQLGLAPLSRPDLAKRALQRVLFELEGG